MKLDAENKNHYIQRSIQRSIPQIENAHVPGKA
jgi:hypothetical protein